MERDDNINRFDYNAAVALGVVLVIAVGIRTFCFSGVVGSADLAYLEEARNVAGGASLAEAHPFLNKPGFLYVEAFTMKVFGANETAQLAYPFLMSLAGVALAFVVARRLWGTWAGVVAGVALALVPLDVLCATQVYPDGATVTLIAAAVSATVFGRRGKHPALWAALSGAAAGAAYLHSNTAVIALPVAVAALVLGGSRKRALLRDLTIIVFGFAAVGSIELWRNAALAGDPFLSWRTAFAPGAGEPLAGDVLFRRLTADYGNALFWDASGLGTLVAVGTAAAILAVSTKDRSAVFTVVWFGVMLFALNLWPESVRPYVPVPYKAARYFLPLAFPAALLAARAGAGLLESGALRKPVIRWAGTFAFVFFATLLIADGSRHYFWVLFWAYAAPVAVLVFLIGWARRTRKHFGVRNAAHLGFAAAFLLIAMTVVPGIALRFYAVPGSGNERWAIEMANAEGIQTLYTDRRSGRIISYLTGYSGDPVVVDFAEENPAEGDTVLINRARYARLRASGYRIPRFARRVPDTWVKIARVEGAAPRPAAIFRVE